MPSGSFYVKMQDDMAGAAMLCAWRIQGFLPFFIIAA
jgi:hypothetical protein